MVNVVGVASRSGGIIATGTKSKFPGGMEVGIEVAPDGIKRSIEADPHRLPGLIQDQTRGLPAAHKAIEETALVREPAFPFAKGKLVSKVPLDDMRRIIAR